MPGNFSLGDDTVRKGPPDSGLGGSVLFPVPPPPEVRPSPKGKRRSWAEQRLGRPVGHSHPQVPAPRAALARGVSICVPCTGAGHPSAFLPTGAGRLGAGFCARRGGDLRVGCPGRRGAGRERDQQPSPKQSRAFPDSLPETQGHPPLTLTPSLFQKPPSRFPSWRTRAGSCQLSG